MRNMSSYSKLNKGAGLIKQEDIDAVGAMQMQMQMQTFIMFVASSHPTKCENLRRLAL
jgi:hypothetical protein